MRVLITGASGFLGKWLVDACHKKGYEIHIFARESSDLSSLKGIPFIRHNGELNDKESLKKSLENIDLVMHLAGLIAYKKSEYQRMWQTNVEGTTNLIKAMKEMGLKDMVYLSSVVAIGASRKPTTLNEGSDFNIKDLHLGYFDSKHEAEKRVLKAYDEGWLNPIIINPSTIYGPGDMTKGSRKSQKKVAQGNFPFYTSGGVNVVHVEDVISLIFIALEKKVYGKRIIAAGENIFIRDLFFWIADFSGVKRPRFYLPNFLVFLIAYISEALEKVGLKGPISLENAHTATMFHWFDNSYAKSLGMEFKPSKIAIKESVQWGKENGYI